MNSTFIAFPTTTRRACPWHDGLTRRAVAWLVLLFWLCVGMACHRADAADSSRYVTDSDRVYEAEDRAKAWQAEAELARKQYADATRDREELDRDSELYAVKQRLRQTEYELLTYKRSFERQRDNLHNVAWRLKGCGWSAIQVNVLFGLRNNQNTFPEKLFATREKEGWAVPPCELGKPPKPTPPVPRDPPLEKTSRRVIRPSHFVWVSESEVWLS